jgi:hypothetical protein
MTPAGVVARPDREAGLGIRSSERRSLRGGAQMTTLLIIALAVLLLVFWLVKAAD